MFGRAAVALAHCPGESVPAPGGAAKKVPKSTEMRVPSRRGCENMRRAKHASAGWGARSWCGACECATIGLTISPASAMARTRCYGPAKLQSASPMTCAWHNQTDLGKRLDSQLLLPNVRMPANAEVTDRFSPVLAHHPRKWNPNLDMMTA